MGEKEVCASILPLPHLDGFQDKGTPQESRFGPDFMLSMHDDGDDGVLLGKNKGCGVPLPKFAIDPGLRFAC